MPLAGPGNYRREGLLYEDEYYGARKVLSAAALTYVAALLTSLLYLARYVMVF